MYARSLPPHWQLSIISVSSCTILGFKLSTGFQLSHTMPKSQKTVLITGYEPISTFKNICIDKSPLLGVVLEGSVLRLHKSFTDEVCRPNTSFLDQHLQFACRVTCHCHGASLRIYGRIDNARYRDSRARRHK
jgi:hypothetical protein